MADHQDSEVAENHDDADARDDDARDDAVRDEAPARERADDRSETQKRTDPRKEREAAAKQQDDERRGRRRSWIIRIVFLVLVIAGLAYFTLNYLATKNLVSTDDAFTDGRVVSVAPRISGQVVQLAVDDNQTVHKGDLLFQIDPRDYQAARDEAAGELAIAQGQLANAQAGLARARVVFPAQLAAAQGNLAAVQGQLFKAQQDYRRQHAIARQATTQADVDSSTSAQQQAEGLVKQAEAQVLQATPIKENVDQAEAQTRQLDGLVKQAQAKLDQANLNLTYTRVVAPQDGRVTKRNIEVGDYAQTGAVVLSLVTPEVWITANFKEDQLGRMRPGQRVDIAIDAYPDLALRGHVDSIQMGSGSKFTAFPPENATGNFVKIVQRVPVKIDIDSGLDPKLPLPLGLSAAPTVNLGDTAEPKENGQGAGTGSQH